VFLVPGSIATLPVSRRLAPEMFADGLADEGRAIHLPLSRGTISRAQQLLADHDLHRRHMLSLFNSRLNSQSGGYRRS